MTDIDLGVSPVAEPRRRRWWWLIAAAAVVVVVAVGVLVVVMRGGGAGDGRTVRLEVTSKDGGTLATLMYGTEVSGATVLGDSEFLAEQGLVEGQSGATSVELPWSQEVTIEEGARRLIFTGMPSEPGTATFGCRLLLGDKVVKEAEHNVAIDCSMPVTQIFTD